MRLGLVRHCEAYAVGNNKPTCSQLWQAVVEIGEPIHRVTCPEYFVHNALLTCSVTRTHGRRGAAHCPLEWEIPASVTASHPVGSIVLCLWLLSTGAQIAEHQNVSGDALPFQATQRSTILPQKSDVRLLPGWLRTGKRPLAGEDLQPIARRHNSRCLAVGVCPATCALRMCRRPSSCTLS